MAKKKTPKHSKKTDFKGYIIAVIIVVILIAAAYVLIDRYNITLNGDAVAIVNGEQISQKELDDRYEKLPEQYKVIITKELLLDQMINTILLLQGAENKEITVTDEDVELELENMKGNLFETDEEFQLFLEENQIDMDELKMQTKEQLMVNQLLDQEVLLDLEVSESEVRAFYDKNREAFGNITYSEVKEQIEQSLFEELSSGAIQTYIEELRENADIVIVGESVEEKLEEEIEEEPLEEQEEVVEEETEEHIGEESWTFVETDDNICKKDEKPIIRFYSASNCKLCDWASVALHDVLEEYKDDVIAYHWELDTGDDILTEEIEKGIPKDEISIFRAYNERSSVPTYVFGCKYVRIGNGYNDLEMEEEEFKLIIQKLLE